MDDGQFVQQMIDGQSCFQAAAVDVQQVFHTPEGYELRVGLPARMVNQLSPDDTGGNGEEMATIPPVSVLGRHHAKVDLVHQFGSLQAVIFGFTPDKIPGEAVEVRKNQPEQVVFGSAVAVSPFSEQPRELFFVFHYTSTCKKPPQLDGY